MWNLKRNDTNELTKQKETHRLRKRTYGCWGEGIVRKFGMDMYHCFISSLLNQYYFIKMVKNKH